MPSREAAPDRVWIFDFDGTLSPLVPDRRTAALHPEARTVLSELVAWPRQAVAVLSSRLLDDLAARVDIRGLYLGGGSGAEWLLPGGERRTADGKTLRLRHARGAVMPELDRLREIPGADVEDKHWSVAVHVRRIAPEERPRVLSFLEALARTTGIRLLRGPEVFEIQLLPEIDKLFGSVVLCEMLRHVPVPGSLVYAGDDENDAVAMEWVIRQGGVALFVGTEPMIPGTRLVDGPESLVREVRRLARMDVKE